MQSEGDHTSLSSVHHSQTPCHSLTQMTAEPMFRCRENTSEKVRSGGPRPPLARCSGASVPPLPPTSAQASFRGWGLPSSHKVS